MLSPTDFTRHLAGLQSALLPHPSCYASVKLALVFHVVVSEECRLQLGTIVAQVSLIRSAAEIGKAHIVGEYQDDVGTHEFESITRVAGST